MRLYMHVAGINGQVFAKGLEGAIALRAMHLCVQGQTQIRQHKQANGACIRPAIHEVVVVKAVDATTPLFFQAVTVGRVMPHITLKSVHTGSPLQDDFSITLTSAMVSGQHIDHDRGLSSCTSSAHSSTKVMEKLSFTFERILFKYTPFDKRHQAGSPIMAHYHLTGPPA